MRLYVYIYNRRNTVLQQVANIPRYAAKQTEDMKVLADMTSSQPIAASHGRQHVLAPFAMEDGGRLGAHAQALLRALAISALSKGRAPPMAGRMVDAPYPMQVFMWVRLWQQRLFAWLRLALSCHAMSLICHATVAELPYF